MAKIVNALKRKTSVRDVRNRFLIVCEGTKTEPNYFRAFQVDKNIIEVTVEGAGHVTDSLVEKAIEEKESAEKQKKPYNQVWCVFDRDSNPLQNFNNAIAKARENNIKIAYSNESFELWYILHFEYLQSALSRERYIEKLNNVLELRYQKNSENMYNNLKDKQAQAIRNANKLLHNYNPPNPAKDNPSTTVHLLVNELNKFLK